MTFNDVKVIKNPGTAFTFNAEDRTTTSITTTMKPGEPVKRGGTGGNFVIPLATGDPEISTDILVGIVAKTSTEGSTTDGEVEITQIDGGRTWLRADATTSTNIDTAAKLLALQGDYVTFDLTAVTGTNGKFTVDENEGDDPNVHGLMIITGDFNKGTLDVLPHALATASAPLIGQTMD